MEKIRLKKVLQLAIPLSIIAIMIIAFVVNSGRELWNFLF